MDQIFMESVAAVVEQGELNREEEAVLDEVPKLLEDQAGCRLLQKKLVEASVAFKDALIEALLPHLIALVKDQFGNYLA